METNRVTVLWLKRRTLHAVAGTEPFLFEEAAAFVFRRQQQQIRSVGFQQGQSGVDHLTTQTVHWERKLYTGQITALILDQDPDHGDAHLGVVLEHELVSGQEVLFGKQLHVLADVLHKLDGIRLPNTIGSERFTEKDSKEWSSSWRVTQRLALSFLSYSVSAVPDEAPSPPLSVYLQPLLSSLSSHHFSLTVCLWCNTSTCSW